MIFFLDMDGVLNNARACMSKKRDIYSGLYSNIDPICVDYINAWAQIIKLDYDDDTSIVLTSTWRSSHDSYRTIDMMYGVMGLEPPAHQDFKTCETAQSNNGVADIRGNQINDWLSNHPEEKHWIIIDDDSDFTDEQKHRHIHTDAYNGIMLEHHINFEKVVVNIYDGSI